MENKTAVDIWLRIFTKRGCIWSSHILEQQRKSNVSNWRIKDSQLNKHDNPYTMKEGQNIINITMFIS
jgi:hypothetical protein